MRSATNSAIAPAAPIAIVGIGCRLPGRVLDPASFWQLLVEGRQVIREVPPDRWSLAAHFHPDRAAAGAIASRWGGFLDTLKEFDAGFWGVSPREAQRMDPQQRWLLEVAWEAIEDAGTAPSRLRGAPVGVFIGISGNDYGGLQLRDIEQVDAYTNSGNTASIASNRISYMLDLRGPSVSVDTACSSSLVAVAMACDSLRTGACETALAGGVNALIAPQVSVGFSKASMLSPSARCYPFDARADGYVRAEGVGVVVLKPLERARADRDRIYAVIRGTAVNQDGHTSSMTVPSVDGQSAMLRAAYANADIAPASVAYVEAHGTGTPVGDPIEATALGRVLGAGRTPDEACVIGSVKANIGHLESASGIAGLIKATLVAHHRLIPASLNCERPNPRIPFESLRLVVANRTRPLAARTDEPPIVGVNSFGFGGTNAHVVLQSPPLARESAPAIDRADRPVVLPISARDDTALRAYVSAFRRCLQNGTEPLADLCAAAGSRKEHHTHRLVVAGRTGPELDGRLRQWLRDGHAPGVVLGRTTSDRSPVFVFTGQGGQWWGMGRTLAAREPVVRRRLEEADLKLRAFSGSSLIDELNRDEVDSQIDRTDIAQPALFALQLGGPNIVELSTTVLRLLAPSLADGSNAAGQANDASATAVVEAAPAADHLILLQRGDRHAPIFAFHPAGGGVQVYSGLARQLPNTLIYGVESRLKRGAAREYDSIDAMVERYVSAVRGVGGAPYRLVGFSLGGYLAARVAEALEAAGDEVRGVGVIDWDVPAAYNPRGAARTAD